MAMDKDLLRLYLHDPQEKAISAEDLDKVIARVGEDFNAILAEGWRIKAGSVADWYEASIDGRLLSRDQVFRHCHKMAELYASEAGSSLRSTRMEVTPPPEAEAEMS